MNDNDINNKLRYDAQLREAVWRHEQQSPPFPTGLNERVMQEVGKSEQNRRRTRHRVGMMLALTSAAACLLLVLTHGLNTHEAVEETKTIAEVKTETKTETKTIAKMEVIASEEKKESAEMQKSVVGKKPRKKVRKKEPAIETKLVAQEQYADTLGNHIFQSPENVLIAMKMLEECDAVIRNEMQEVRNNVIDATFRVAPPSGSAILVKDISGDLDVVDRERQRIIEL
jgi:superfamily II DNA helicase RecQ